MRKFKRINITIGDELLNKTDSYAEKRCLSRSCLISLALSYYLDYLDSTQNISSVSNHVDKFKG